MTDLVITNSLIKQFKSCQNATKYKYVDLLTPKVRRSKPLKRGIWFHELLEAKYKDESVTEAHKRNTTKFNRLSSEEQEILGDLPAEMASLYAGYQWHYRQDKSWTVCEVEIKLEAELPNGSQGQGKADMLVEDEWGLWAVDHKTHLKLPSEDYRILDPQAPFYIWLFRQCGIPVRGFIWNYVVPEGPKPLRFKKDGELYKVQPAVTDYPTAVKGLTDDQLNNPDFKAILDRLENVRYDEDTPQSSPIFQRHRREPNDETINRVIADITDTSNRYVEWLTELTNNRQPERTVSRNCEWCDFKSLCISDLTGGNSEGVRHREYVAHDPFDYYKEDRGGN